ncbi:MAG: 3-deoxy-8-phosphooctulonate synthase [Oligoflexia bacterium]|nr:3-deoxy-8-phosphooctulonate synthase [Oligoflexia bacterium]
MRNNEFAFIAGPCVIENREKCFLIAERLLQINEALNKIAKVSFTYKASFDKANRSDIKSYRGPGLEAGLEILKEVKSRYKCGITTDIHLPEQAYGVAGIADMIQIPAFLSRQTDLLLAAGKTGKTVNVKKGQFMSPKDTDHIVEKIKTTGNTDICVTERGTFFGYGNLVVDMSSFVYLKRHPGIRVIFDATHSAPSYMGDKREIIPHMASAAAGTGFIDGVFLEVHDEPDKALCDGPCSLDLDLLQPMMERVLKIWLLAGEASGNV